MLILQRKPGESVMIGSDISISAISAPVEVPILRRELIAAAAVNQDSAREESDPAALLDLLSGPPPSSP